MTTPISGPDIVAADFGIFDSEGLRDTGEGDSDSEGLGLSLKESDGVVVLVRELLRVGVRDVR